MNESLGSHGECREEGRAQASLLFEPPLGMRKKLRHRGLSNNSQQASLGRGRTGQDEMAACREKAWENEVPSSLLKSPFSRHQNGCSVTRIAPQQCAL